MVAPSVSDLVASPPHGRGLSPGFHSAWTNDWRSPQPLSGPRVRTRPRPPREVIVVDDHSGDGTGARATAPGARVIRHNENRGSVGSRNSDLEAAACDWPAFWTATTSGGRITSHTMNIRSSPALVGGSAWYRMSRSRRYAVLRPLSREPMEFDSPERLLAAHSFVNTNGSIVRQDAALATAALTGGGARATSTLGVRLLERYLGSRVCAILGCSGLGRGSDARVSLVEGELAYHAETEDVFR